MGTEKQSGSSQVELIPSTIHPKVFPLSKHCEHMLLRKVSRQGKTSHFMPEHPLDLPFYHKDGDEVELFACLSVNFSLHVFLCC